MTLTELGKEAAASSIDAHGGLVDENDAFQFILQLHIDDDDADADFCEPLLSLRFPPAEFINAYYGDVAA
ncbi:MAG: hypothetical protein NVS1B11_36640 [Terriglobales bacterium]